MRRNSESFSSDDSDHTDKSDFKLVKSSKNLSKQEKEKKKMALKIVDEISRDFSEDDLEIQEFTKRSPTPKASRLKSRIDKASKESHVTKNENLSKSDSTKKTGSRPLSRAGAAA